MLRAVSEESGGWSPSPGVSLITALSRGSLLTRLTFSQALTKWCCPLFSVWFTAIRRCFRAAVSLGFILLCDISFMPETSSQWRFCASRCSQLPRAAGPAELWISGLGSYPALVCKAPGSGSGPSEQIWSWVCVEVTTSQSGWSELNASTRQSDIDPSLIDWLHGILHLQLILLHHSGYLLYTVYIV